MLIALNSRGLIRRQLRRWIGKSESSNTTPELYEIVKDAELLSAVFKVLPEDEGQQRSLRIHIEPAKGK